MYRSPVMREEDTVEESDPAASSALNEKGRTATFKLFKAMALLYYI